MSNNHRHTESQPKGFTIRHVGGTKTYIHNAKVDVNPFGVIVVRNNEPDRTHIYPISNILEIDMPGTLNIQQGKIFTP